MGVYGRDSSIVVFVEGMKITLTPGTIRVKNSRYEKREEYTKVKIEVLYFNKEVSKVFEERRFHCNKGFNVRDD